MENETIYRQNRELSWLKFNDRVLMQAKDKNVPLAEKLTFISIYQTNLDEFFRVRVGSLYDEMLYYPTERENKTYMTAEEQIHAILDRLRTLNRKKDRYYKEAITELKDYGVRLLHFDDISRKEDLEYLDTYFESQILPLLSPQVISRRQPFPFLNNNDLYIAAQLTNKKGKRKLGIVSIVHAEDMRLIHLSDGSVILLEDVLTHYLPQIFRNQKVERSSVIRVTRSADIDEDEMEDTDDYRSMMEDLIRKRRKLHPLRLEYTKGLEKQELSMMAEFLGLKEKQLFPSESPLDFSFFGEIRDMLKGSHPELFYKPLAPQNSAMVENRTPMIRQILKHDILLAYPFESMSPFLRLLDEAATDPRVASIKMTLYRVAKNSRVIKSLIRAVENGKDVVVLVELRARFDEENNIEQSKALEKAGAHVIYGLTGYKVHSKLCLITYLDKADKVQYITQIGTGNYNEKTAQLYTDLCLMTSRRSIGEDANIVFNHLAQEQTVHHINELMAAPHAMQDRIMAYIDQEIEKAKNGNPAYVGFKCNSVTSKPMIEKLVEASQAGVKIDMIVRGICCITPGIPGYTDNINIISIVGRYLEHSRIYIFGADNPAVYISSADLMTRNLERRVEIAAPIYDEKIKKKILSMFWIMLNDNVKASVLGPDGKYKKIRNKKKKLNSQEFFFSGFTLSAKDEK
ncbi:MAG: polyphosphate kinase 1 [Lachnospiraceae bacterium]|nr:polyphosphate kinase 1 [Lachnospiraceae bacterium]